MEGERRSMVTFKFRVDDWKSGGASSQQKEEVEEEEAVS